MCKCKCAGNIGDLVDKNAEVRYLLEKFTSCVFFCDSMDVIWGIVYVLMHSEK